MNLWLSVTLSQLFSLTNLHEIWHMGSLRPEFIQKLILTAEGLKSLYEESSFTFSIRLVGRFRDEKAVARAKTTTKTVP